MEKRLRKKETRGGRRFRRIKLTNAQQALICELIRALGGPTKAARVAFDATQEKAFFDRNLINWRGRSGVPLKHCTTLGKIFKTPASAWNYKAVTEARLEDMSWEKAVRGCEALIGKDRVKFILERRYR